MFADEELVTSRDSILPVIWKAIVPVRWLIDEYLNYSMALDQSRCEKMTSSSDNDYCVCYGVEKKNDGFSTKLVQN